MAGDDETIENSPELTTLGPRGAPWGPTGPYFPSLPQSPPYSDDDEIFPGASLCVTCASTGDPPRACSYGGLIGEQIV